VGYCRLVTISTDNLVEGLCGEPSAQREAERLIVNEFAPPGVIVNAQLQVIQFRGATADYLTPPRGKASFDVLKMAREGLMLPLRAAINKAKKENQPARKDNVRVERNGRERLVDIQVIPLKNVKERSYLVLFQEVTRSAIEGGTGGRQQRVRSEQDLQRASGVSPASAAGERADIRSSRRRLAQSQRELAETRDYLQAIQEQRDAANEPQASSEEAQTANEELQSINDGLETSKEELESTNEELTTVNEEMANRSARLHQLNAESMRVSTPPFLCSGAT
jgi:two-component system CheB/CheR fusion protein